MGQHPLAVVQLRELLLDAHGFHPVDIALLGDIEHTLLHVERGVLQDVEVASETEVLLVGGIETEVIATVARHLHRVLYIEMVETDGRAADRTWEGILHEADVVVIEVHVREDLL